MRNFSFSIPFLLVSRSFVRGAQLVVGVSGVLPTHPIIRAPYGVLGYRNYVVSGAPSVPQYVLRTCSLEALPLLPRATSSESLHLHPTRNSDVTAPQPGREWKLET